MTSATNVFCKFNLKINKNKLDPVYEILFALLREHEFCYSATCYTLPIFSIRNTTTFQVSVQTAEQSLVPAVYISCTIQPNLRTSVFSHQIALVDGDTLNFQANQLPSIKLVDLIYPKVDQTTRALQTSDYVKNRLYLIYSGKKVSLQCVTAQMITVNNEKQFCDQTTLNFIHFPESIFIGEKQVLKVAIPHHFSRKLDFLNTDMRSVSIFQQTDFEEPHFGNQVISFFQTAETIHYSFMSVTFVCCILFSCITCCLCYIKCPTCLVKLFCCCANTCCLKQKVVQRDEELNRPHTTLPRTVYYQVQQNPNIPLNPIQFQPPLGSDPSAPPPQQPYNAPPQPCPKNHPSCLCQTTGQCIQMQMYSG